MTIAEAIAVLEPLRNAKRLSIKIEPPAVWIWGHSQEIEATKWDIWISGPCAAKSHSADTLEMAVKMAVEHITESHPSIEAVEDAALEVSALVP